MDYGALRRNDEQGQRHYQRPEPVERRQNPALHCRSNPIHRNRQREYDENCEKLARVRGMRELWKI